MLSYLKSLNPARLLLEGRSVLTMEVGIGNVL